MRIVSRCLAALCFYLAILVPAVAQPVDPMKFAFLLMEQGTANGMKFDIGEAKSDGKDVILRQIKFNDGQKYDELRLENVRALANGGYMIGRIAMPASKVDTGDGVWSLGAWSLSEILVPSTQDKKSPAFYWQTFEMQPSHFVDRSRKMTVGIGRQRWVSSPYAAGQLLKSQFEPFDVTFDARAWPVAHGLLPEFMSGPMTLEVAGEGSWRDSDGFSSFVTTLNLKDFGKLGIKLELSGLTSGSLRELGAAAAVPNPLAGAGMANVIDIGQNLKLHGFSMRYDDTAFARKSIDASAKKSGQSRAQFVAQAKEMVPMMLAGLGDPKLTADASTAVAAFLDNPKSLELKLQPTAPVPLMDSGLPAMTNPQSMARRFGLSVTANR